MKPMLAATVNRLEELRFPLIASPKLDGIRALVLDQTLRSRKLRPIDNPRIRQRYELPELEGMDGELILGNPTHPEVFLRTTSAVRNQSGNHAVTFYIFDNPIYKGTFEERYDKLTREVPKLGLLGVEVLQHYYVEDIDDVLRLEKLWLGEGYEGVMLRHPEGPYKFGRSTLREHYLLKLKRYDIDSAVVIGFEEEMENRNEATRSATGRIKRSKRAEGLVGKGTLGALIARATSGQFEGREFNVTGFTNEMKSRIWENRDEYLGAEFEFEHFPIGAKDRPRHPTFRRFI